MRNTFRYCFVKYSAIILTLGLGVFNSANSAGISIEDIHYCELGKAPANCCSNKATGLNKLKAACDNKAKCEVYDLNYSTVCSDADFAPQKLKILKVVHRCDGNGPFSEQMIDPATTITISCSL